MIRTITAWVAAMTAAALLLTACQSALPGIRQEPESKLSGTLRVALLGGFESKEVKPYKAGFKKHPIQDRMKAFTELHPNVEIEVLDLVTGLGSNMLTMKTLLDRAEEYQPDIIEMTPAEAGLLARDRIVSLADLVEERSDAWSGAYLEVIERMALDGEPYLLPVRSDPMLIYYDRAALRMFGLAEPSEGWTMTEFGELVRAAVGAGLQVLLTAELETAQPFIEALGGSFPAQHEAAAGVLDSDATTAALEALLQAVPAEAMYNNPYLMEYESSALGMAWASRLYKAIRSEKGDYAIASLPSGADGSRRNISLMTGLAIHKDSPQQELARELLKYIGGESSDEAMNFLADNTLQQYRTGYRYEPVSRDDELKQWLMREATVARPVGLSRMLTSHGTYGTGYPPLFIADKHDWGREELKTQLGEWARQIDAYRYSP